MIAMLALAVLAQDAGWTPLWNGKDLDGWETWLGKPDRRIDVPGLERNEKGESQGAVGLDRDPKGVFSVVEVDGAPAIRISGEIWGALTTKGEYENYQLSDEFKWGAKRWPPREHTVRDSGVLYHAVGKHGAQSGFWMKSFEIQVQEGDGGDFHSLVGVKVDVEAERRDPKDAKSPLVRGVSQRILKSPDAEKPTGEWNRMEVLAAGQTAVHVVNGKTVLVLTGLRQADGAPLTKGRIQVQSEGAEVYYRNIRLRPLKEIPAPSPE
jgi:hypothetical protein